MTKDESVRNKNRQRKVKPIKGKKPTATRRGKLLLPIHDETPSAVAAQMEKPVGVDVVDVKRYPYNENLLEYIRAQWQVCNWEVLAQLERGVLLDHPDRAKLALYAAAGHQQQGNYGAVRRFVRLAREWGCSKKMVSHILIAGVHFTLARSAAAAGHLSRALKHFELSVAAGAPGSSSSLQAQACLGRELKHMGIVEIDGFQFDSTSALSVQDKASDRNLSPGLNDVRRSDQQGQSISKQLEKQNAAIKILETKLELLHHELSLAQQRQLHGAGSDRSVSDFNDPAWLPELKKRACSQLGQDLWVLEKTGYKRGGYFVEFGATDGVLLSNTWLLEKEFGWNGICAEPNPTLFDQLKKNRACVVSDACIAGETGREIEFVLADAFGGMCDYANADMHADKRAAYREAGRTVFLKTISLHDFLVENTAPRTIDYLSIDTEGGEYDILRTFPFEQWDIRLLTVEHNYTEMRHKIRKLLEDNGYRCREQQWDDWYYKNEPR